MAIVLACLVPGLAIVWWLTCRDRCRQEVHTQLWEMKLSMREDAADATDLPLTTFSEACPWSVEQVLDPSYWPDAPTQAVRPRRPGP